MRLGRAARNWGQLGLQLGLLVAGLALLQVTAERTNRRFDLTSSRTLSVAPITRKVLAEATDPLRITVFFRRGTREQYADLATRLRAADPRVDVALYDLDRFPGRARALGVTEYGRAAIEYAGRRTIVPALPEDELAGGILRALRGRPRRVVFSTGHGERAPGGDAESYARLASALEAENYVPEGASLLDGSLPAGTDLLVIAGPRHDFLVPELDAVARHLHAGGGVLMLLEPGPLPNLSRFLAGFGIALRDDFIVDRERRVVDTDGLAAVVEFFKRGNPVSDPPSNPLASGVILPSARTVDVAGPVPGVEADSIARTAATAWAIADVARARRGDEPSEAEHDVHGPASVAVMAEIGGRDGDGPRRGRLVVVGDADFASDAYLDLLGNRDLVLNAVAWAGGEEAMTGHREASVPDVARPLSPLVLTESQAHRVFLASVVVEPAVVLFSGVLFVALRRRRG